MHETGFRLTHHRYESRTMQPLHTHAGPHFVLVYDGQWEDVHDSRVRRLEAGELLFHPAGIAHQNGTDGAAEVIVIHLARSRMAPFSRLYGPAPRSVQWSFELLEGIPQRLRQEAMRADSATPFILSALITQLLAVGSRASGGQALLPVLKGRTGRSACPPPWLATVLQSIDSSLGEPLSLPALAAQANISPSHLAHAFPKAMGCTVGEYIRIARIRAAAAALRESDLPIQEIAYRTGFYDQAHLCRAFKAAHGVTPGDYRTNA